jgi:activator of HSP90 ATPase
MANQIGRRDFSIRLASVVGFAALARPGRQEPQAEGLSSTAEAIHQAVPLDASPARVYEALTDATRFTQVTTHSMVKNAPPAVISRAAGGAFSLFGGHVLERQVELVPGQRVVQAWRAADWDAGVYSIARFELKPSGSGTVIIFDHTGFPAGQGAHLSAGWRANYWEPLKQYLAT